MDPFTGLHYVAPHQPPSTQAEVPIPLRSAGARRKTALLRCRQRPAVEIMGWFKYIRVTSTDPRNTKWNRLECPVTLELGDYNCTPEVEGVPQARHS